MDVKFLSDEIIDTVTKQSQEYIRSADITIQQLFAEINLVGWDKFKEMHQSDL